MSEGRQVVLLSGGVVRDSKTTAALRVVAGALETEGIATRLITLADHPLPFLMPTGPVPPEIEELRAIVEDADGIVTGSPEYHAAPSGALKNMIDCLSPKQVGGKPVGLVAVCGSARGGTNTLNVLRIVFRSLQAPVLVEQAIVSDAEFEGVTVAAPAALAYLKRVAEGMARELRRG